MARDHTPGLNTEGYAECAICAKTFRKTALVEQRGLMVCTESCYDDTSNQDNEGDA